MFRERSAIDEIYDRSVGAAFLPPFAIPDIIVAHCASPALLKKIAGRDCEARSFARNLWETGELNYGSTPRIRYHLDSVMKECFMMLLFSNGPFVPLCRPITVETPPPPPPSMFQSPPTNAIYCFKESSINLELCNLFRPFFNYPYTRIDYATPWMDLTFNILLSTKNFHNKIMI